MGSKIEGLVFSIFLITVLVTGTVAVGMTTDAFAGGQGNQKGKDSHGQKGCDTATASSQGKTNNPHCEDEPEPCPDGQHRDETTGECVPDTEPPTQLTECDINGDGEITLQELLDSGYSLTAGAITTVENGVLGNPSINGIIDTQDEVDKFNEFFFNKPCL